MKKAVSITLLAAVIGVMFALAAQSARYAQLRQAARALVEEQRSLLETNRNLLAGNAVLAGKKRIDEIAAETLGLARATADRILRIRIAEGRKKTDG